MSLIYIFSIQPFQNLILFDIHTSIYIYTSYTHIFLCMSHLPIKVPLRLSIINIIHLNLSIVHSSSVIVSYNIGIIYIRIILLYIYSLK